MMPKGCVIYFGIFFLSRLLTLCRAKLLPHQHGGVAPAEKFFLKQRAMCA